MILVPLARALSKLGVMSRSEAIKRVLAGDVRVSGRVVRDPGFPVLSDWLLDPGNAIPRTYIVTVRGVLSDADVIRIQRGVRDRGELLRRAHSTC